MTVRNKKKSQANRLKVENAQHQKQFITELKGIITKAAGAEIARFIPQHQYEHLYNIRFRPVKVKEGPGESVDEDILKFINYMTTHFLKHSYINVNVGNLTWVSLYSFFTTVNTAIIFGRGLKADAYAHASEIKQALAPLAAILEAPVFDEILDKYYDIMFLISVFCCDINDYLYSIEFHPENFKKSLFKTGMYSEIYKTPLPKIKIQLEEIARPALHVGWCFQLSEPRLELLKLDPKDISLPPGNKLDVYIQSHAINRLSERMEGIDLGVLHFNIYNSLCEPKICRNKKGLLLFEYSIFNNKAGYFLAEVIAGKIVLKTFLFLTNTGTPEADKLQTATGLMKEDIIYLAIDKLSTFLFSDIASNDRIKQLFIDAGCESLFKIQKGHFFSPINNSTTSKADMIAKYLQLDDLPKYRKHK